MGEIVSLDDYREKKKKEEEDERSQREHRLEEIMGWLDDFFIENPVENKPFYVSASDMYWSGDKTDMYFDYYSKMIEIDKDDNEE